MEDGFCRETILNIINPMIYFHDLLTKCMNTVTKFLFSCNKKGIFNRAVPPPDYMFHTEYYTKSNLNLCNKNINKVDWLDSCSPVCDKVMITSFNRTFLAPSLKQFRHYNEFLNEKLSNFDKDEPKPVVVVEKTDEDERLLLDEKSNQ